MWRSRSCSGCRTRLARQRCFGVEFISVLCRPFLPPPSELFHVLAALRKVVGADQVRLREVDADGASAIGGWSEIDALPLGNDVPALPLAFAHKAPKRLHVDDLLRVENSVLLSQRTLSAEIGIRIDGTKTRPT